MTTTKTTKANISLQQAIVLTALAEPGTSVSLGWLREDMPVDKQSTDDLGTSHPKTTWFPTDVTVNGRSAKALADKGYLTPLRQGGDAYSTRWGLSTTGAALLASLPDKLAATAKGAVQSQRGLRLREDALSPLRSALRKARDTVITDEQAVLKELRASNYDRSHVFVVNAVANLAVADEAVRQAELAFNNVAALSVEYFLTQPTNTPAND